jgi:hypothetical protein
MQDTAARGNGRLLIARARAARLLIALWLRGVVCYPLLLLPLSVEWGCAHGGHNPTLGATQSETCALCCLRRCGHLRCAPLYYTDRVPDYVCSRWSTQCASRTFPRRKSFSWIRRMIPKALKRTKLPPLGIEARERVGLCYADIGVVTRFAPVFAGSSWSSWAVPRRTRTKPTS